MLKKMLNQKVHGTSVYTLARTYMLWTLIASVVLLFGLAAAGVSVGREYADITVTATMVFVLAIGISFIVLDYLSERSNPHEILLKPFGYTWKQWALMASGLAIALVVGPVVCGDDNEEKTRSLKMATTSGGQ